MKRMKLTGICITAICALGGVAAGEASAALPELGRCVKVEGVKEGSKTVYSGQFKGKRCGPESPTHTGKYEFIPGPPPEPAFTGAAAGEAVGLETVGGRKIACGVGRFEGTYTGPKSEKVTFTLNECEDTQLHKKCQSFAPEEKEPKPIPGTIKSLPLTGELGFISGAGTGKPIVGWDVKPEAGSILATFECGELLVGTKVTLEGSLISQIKPLGKMSEEFKDLYKAVKGVQIPEKFETGPKDTLSLTFMAGLESTTEQAAYTASEEFNPEEAIEFKAKP